MVHVIPLCLALTLGQEPVVQTQFVQVAPLVAAGQPLIRSIGQQRAVVLIHGLSFWPPKKGEARAELHSYQKPNAPLVQRLAVEADVFALAYEQNIPVTEYAGLAVFRQNIQRVRELGYTEIVLVGFSAGGLIARQFVEDIPDTGVTKVIQVDSPNLGTAWASGSHDVFRRSLSTKARREFLQLRPGMTIPDTIQFACMVGSGFLEGDGIVSIKSQWPKDLQWQGIPARSIPKTHIGAARSEAGVKLIAELVQENVPRLNAAEVAAMRKRMLDFVVSH